MQAQPRVPKVLFRAILAPSGQVPITGITLLESGHLLNKKCICLEGRKRERCALRESWTASQLQGTYPIFLQPCWLHYCWIRWSEFSTEPGWSRRMDKSCPVIPTKPGDAVIGRAVSSWILVRFMRLGQPWICCSAGEDGAEQCASISLYSLSTCSPFCDLGGRAKENRFTASVTPLTACGEPWPGHSASSKGKVGAFTQHFPEAPWELCGKEHNVQLLHTEPWYLARNPSPWSSQKVTIPPVWGFSAHPVGWYRWALHEQISSMTNSLEAIWSQPWHTRSTPE